MKSTSEIHRRALAAATAVIGRPRHRAGVVAVGLWLGGGATACGTLDEGLEPETVTASEGGGQGSETTDDGSTTLATSTLGEPGGSGGSTDDGSLGESTSWAEASSTGSSDSGEESGSMADSTGVETGPGLDDCIDSTGEVDWVCCEEQQWQPAEHCTPWGPPAPPRLRRRAERGRLV